MSDFVSRSNFVNVASSSIIGALVGFGVLLAGGPSWAAYGFAVTAYLLVLRR